MCQKNSVGICVKRDQLYGAALRLLQENYLTFHNRRYKIKQKILGHAWVQTHVAALLSSYDTSVNGNC